MELPKILTPIFEVTLPSTGQKIRVRPFLVKEEKILLMAAASKETKEIIEATKQIINNCLIDPGVKVDKLPFFDIDYLFIALRAKSIGETIDINFKCNNVVAGEKCVGVFPVSLDITKASVIKDETLKNKVNITGKIGAAFKYPSYTAMKNLESESPLTREIKILEASIDYLYDDEKLYPVKDMQPGELTSFLDGLTTAQLELLRPWINSFPSFEIRKEQVCPVCGFNHSIKYRDFTSFF